MMKKYVVLISFAAVLAACNDGDKQAQAPAETAPQAEVTQTAAQSPAMPVQEAEAPAPALDKAALVEEAKSSVQALGGTLKGELQAAMKSGGPVAALDVCHTKAPEIAKQISEEKGLEVKRVSLKNRNPVTGIPNEWQTQVLNDFETRKAAGEDPAALTYAETVGNEFRFMKAIPTGTLCLTCHGTEISPAVMKKLKELYPDDKATGFKEGDLRGAFVVVKKLSE